MGCDWKKPFQGAALPVEQIFEMPSQAAILVADQCLLLRWALTWAMQDRHRIRAVSSGEQALAELRSNKYDILILRSGCSAASCGEVVRRCKDLQPALKVVLLTDLPDHERDCGCHPVDIYRLYEKPFEISKLLDEVERIAATTNQGSPGRRVAPKQANI